jgi:hypothetical protein
MRYSISWPYIFSLDDQLYEAFRNRFPKMDLDPLKLEDLKSESAKAKWREFITEFAKRVDDFNFGALIRLSCNLGYYPS